MCQGYATIQRKEFLVSGSLTSKESARYNPETAHRLLNSTTAEFCQ